MKLYHSLPDAIATPSGVVLHLHITQDIKGTIERCKAEKRKYRIVKVLSRNLRGCTDLYGKKYQPNTFLFTHQTTATK